MTRYDADLAQAAPVDLEPWPGAASAWMTVSLLMLAYFISYVDRTILSLLVEPIKHSLQLSDTKIGLLQSAFGIFFTLATFPAGWVADKGNRTRLVAWGVACWSAMTAFCGFSTNFIQLFFARMGVAIGEATMTPTAPSIIADCFPPERRTLPLSLFGMAGAVGAGISLVTGGFVASLVAGSDTVDILGLMTFEPWQVIFIAVGLPGIFVSLMFFLTREPPRRVHGKSVPTGSARELWEVIKARRAIIVPHFAGVSIYFIHAFAFLAWIPPFFMRVHEWSVSDVGFKYGLLHVTCAIIAGVGGGGLARWFWRRGRRDANLLSSSLLLTAMIVPSIFGTLVSNVALALLFIALKIIFSVATAGPNVASIQEIIPNRFRGRVTAIYFAILSLVGATFGPLVIGLMNDYVFTDPDSIGKSLALTSLLTVPLAAVLVFVAARRRAKLDWEN